MLILSRRPSETLRFPQLGISVTVISVKGSRVQVGIEAPPEIRVLRHELEDRPNEVADRSASGSPAAVTASENKSSEEKAFDQSSHAFRNRLNKATLGLHLAQKQLAAGKFESADKTLTQALVRLSELESTANLALTASANESRATASQEQRPNELIGSKPKEADSKDIHVLLVEDDLNEQALLKSLLEMEGYRVQTASNGYEALVCLQRFSPKFVLLDMMMPGCDGRETLNRIRENPAFEHLPVFAVSGSSPASVGLKIGNDGVEDWFPKPLNASRLLQHMRDKVACLSS